MTPTLLAAITEQSRIRQGCTLCGHEWHRHDPEDGMCDAHATEDFGPCKCGRDLTWMQSRIAASSRGALRNRPTRAPSNGPVGRLNSCE